MLVEVAPEAVQRRLGVLHDGVSGLVPRLVNRMLQSVKGVVDGMAKAQKILVSRDVYPLKLFVDHTLKYKVACFVHGLMATLNIGSVIKHNRCKGAALDPQLGVEGEVRDGLVNTWRDVHNGHLSVLDRPWQLDHHRDRICGDQLKECPNELVLEQMLNAMSPELDSMIELDVPARPNPADVGFLKLVKPRSESEACAIAGEARSPVGTPSTRTLRLYIHCCFYCASAQGKFAVRDHSICLLLWT